MFSPRRGLRCAVSAATRPPHRRVSRSEGRKPPPTKIQPEDKQRCGNDNSLRPRLRRSVPKKSPRMLLPLAALLLCVVPVGAGRAGKAAFYLELDEEIDHLQSIIEKQQVTEIKPPKKQRHDAAVGSQTDVNKGSADASKHGPNTRGRLSDGASHATTATPRLALSVLPDASTPEPIATAVGHRLGPVVVPPTRKDNIIVVIVSLCVVMGAIAVILATVCYVKLQRDSRLAEKVDYPAFGGVGVPAAAANGTSTGDKTLAQSAQMYHYQHQKQQMLSMGNHKPEQKSVDTELTSEEEDVGGDFTVYECPGLAPTGEMEVKNPLFDDSNLPCEESQK